MFLFLNWKMDLNECLFCSQDDATISNSTNNAIDLGTTSYTSTHQPIGVRVNVLNRVGHQQDKWKRQVREQRRNIYDRHTMLN